eukprot:UN01758
MAITASLAAAKDGFCRVLANSGGGDRIAFQLGALEVLVPKLGAEAAYDVVTGISAGSLVSALFRGFPVGQEAQAVAAISNAVWEINGREDIIKDWPGGLIDGLINQSGLFDSTPLSQRIHKYLDNMPPTNREIRVGATCLNDGKMDIWRQNSTNFEKGVLASCSVPGVFPIVPIKGPLGDRSYVDGGAIRNVIITEGVEACLEKGFKPNQVIVDVLLCYANEGFEDVSDVSKYHTVDSLMRTLAVKGLHSAIETLDNTLTKYPDVTFRNILAPVIDLPSVGLNFKKEEMQFMHQHGIDHATEVLKKYPNGNGMEMIKTLRKRAANNYMP